MASRIEMETSGSECLISPVFIVGCPRSGTTLLRDLLSSHPNLTFPPESHFIPLFYRAYGNPQTAQEAEALGQRILNFRTVKTWQVALQPNDFAGYRTFSDILKQLYGAWAKKRDKPRWGDKTPQYVTEIPLLLKLFPGAKVIHIYRDGRDVVASALRANFDANAYTAAIHWKSMVEVGRDAGLALTNEHYLEIRYESLVANAEGTMRSVCDFIKEPYCLQVLEPSYLNPHKFSAGPWVRVHAAPGAKISCDKIGKWRKDLSRPQCAILQSVAGNLLRTLGYEAAGQGRRITVFERARWRLHQAFWYVLSRWSGLIRSEYLQSFWELRLAQARAWFTSGSS